MPQVIETVCRKSRLFQQGEIYASQYEALAQRAPGAIGEYEPVRRIVGTERSVTGVCSGNTGAPCPERTTWRRSAASAAYGQTPRWL